jgi:hypothetical protein
MARVAVLLAFLGATATALPTPSAPHKDLQANLGTCRSWFGGAAFALCHASLHRGDVLTMRLTGGARLANGKTGYTNTYGMAQAVLPNGRGFVAGEGVVVTGTIRHVTDVAVAFGGPQFRGYAVWHLRRTGHRVVITTAHDAKSVRLRFDGRSVSPALRIAPGNRLLDSDLADQFGTDRGAFLRTLSEGGDVCAYLDEALAKKLTPAKCAQLSRQTAQELQSFLPTDELEVSFWDYNGAIYAPAGPRTDSTSRDREVWQLQHGRFRLLVG